MQQRILQPGEIEALDKTSFPRILLPQVASLFAERAARLRQLLPYFLTVLSQVNRGRVSKVRVQAFLRDHTRAPETAAVVAEIYARQVVGAGRLDQPQYMAGLRDIAARHPDVPLPFMQGRAVPSRPGRRPAISPTTAA